MDPQQDNPYAAPVSRLEDPAPHVVLELAERGTRLGAAIIDGMLVLVAMLPMFVAMGVAGGDSGRLDDFMPVGLGITGVLVLGLMAWQLVLLHNHSATFGKKLLGVKIVRTDGSHIGVGRIVGLRIIVVGLLGNIPIVGPIVSLVDPLMIFRDDRRCLHDLIADTVVVKAG